MGVYELAGGTARKLAHSVPLVKQVLDESEDRRQGPTAASLRRDVMQRPIAAEAAPTRAVARFSRNARTQRHRVVGFIRDSLTLRGVHRG